MLNITRLPSFLKIILVFALYAINTTCFGVLHDPTQPPGMENLLDASMSPENIYNIHIDGIILSKEKKNAIINGQQVSIGDKIFNIEVVDINNSSVIFKDENGNFTVPMTESLIKTSTKKIMRKT